jgi:hypothetical protein
MNQAVPSINSSIFRLSFLHNTSHLIAPCASFIKIMSIDLAFISSKLIVLIIQFTTSSNMAEAFITTSSPLIKKYQDKDKQ